ncbi:flagellar hook-basal body complex protein FliE [Lachnospiraceae bacterium KH1T2]|nr:flagellar hook-basal body complex protein FliE [Lachnospiraceae bacterium KH1T2]
MDINKIYNISSPAVQMAEMQSPIYKADTDKSFGTFLNAAIDQLDETNSYLHNQEEEEIKLALGLTDNTHDLAIAQAKAQASLQYTVALRDKLLDAYKEIIQIQI